MFLSPPLCQFEGCAKKKKKNLVNKIKQQIELNKKITKPMIEFTQSEQLCVFQFIEPIVQYQIESKALRTGSI